MHACDQFQPKRWIYSVMLVRVMLMHVVVWVLGSYYCQHYCRCDWCDDEDVQAKRQDSLVLHAHVDLVNNLVGALWVYGCA